MIKKHFLLFLIILTILLSVNIVSANETDNNLPEFVARDPVWDDYDNTQGQVKNIEKNISAETSDNNVKEDVIIDAEGQMAYASQNISLNYHVYSEKTEQVDIPSAVLKINDKTVSRSSVKNGVLTFNFTVPNLREGNHVMTIKTGECDSYRYTEVNTTLSIYRRNVTVTADNIVTYAGENITYKVKVKNADKNVNVPNIILKVAGKTISRSSVIDGTATFKFTTPNLKKGSYDLIIKSGENVYYNSANLTQTLTVYRYNLTLTSNNLVSYVGDSNCLSVKVSTKGVKSLSNIPIVLKINNSTIAKTKITNNTVVFNFKTPNLKKGNYKMEIKVGESNFYNSATLTKSFTVIAKNVTITTDNLTGYAGKNMTFVANFTSGKQKVNIDSSVLKLGNKTLSKQEVVNGSATYSFSLSGLKEGKYTLTIKTGDTLLYNWAVKNVVLTVKKPLKSNLFANSVQVFTTEDVKLKINVTDELNNTVTDGKIALYLNNKEVDSKKVSASNVLTIPKQSVGVYDVKIEYTSNVYESASKEVKLTSNPKSDYVIKLVYNPSLISGRASKIRTTVRNSNKGTLNSGLVKFYFNNEYMGSADTKNNLSSLKINMDKKEGYYPFKVEYYLNNKFIGADSQYMYIHKGEQQVEQSTFITLAADLVSNSKISSTKKDVYFAMDRTTANYDYSPNDMKIMHTISYILEANGFNVKRIKNGPGETYNTAKYMYNNNIKNSICFILCNGVDANVIREYLKGYDNLLTTVRNRGNDIVMGWFHGAGDIYNPDGEFYYWLDKAWDDNYSKWGGMSYPRRTAEKDGIKIVYAKDDLKGYKIADGFIKLYGGKITESVAKNTTLSLKTNLYTTNNQKISGNLVYTLNGKVIKNVTVTGNTYTYKYAMPTISGTYNLKVAYYANNKLVCTTNDRYIKVL